jgi:hypothetical protein
MTNTLPELTITMSGMGKGTLELEDVSLKRNLMV